MKYLFFLGSFAILLTSCEHYAGGNKGDMPVNNNSKSNDPRNGGTTGYINPRTDSTRDNQRFHKIH